MNVNMGMTMRIARRHYVYEKDYGYEFDDEYAYQYGDGH